MLLELSQLLCMPVVCTVQTTAAAVGISHKLVAALPHWEQGAHHHTALVIQKVEGGDGIALCRKQ